VTAVQERRVQLALVPIENSIEGSVTATLDTLAAEAREVSIIGELVLPVRHALVAAQPQALAEIEVVLSHPHVPGQCARFLREQLGQAQIMAASSTAEAVRLVAERNDSGWAAIGTHLAAQIYGCAVLASDIQEHPDNETRFVWLAREEIDLRRFVLDSDPASGGKKTSLIFSGPGAERAGWLVRCLGEFASRQINLTRIESRPRRERLGHYLFFVDLEGGIDEQEVSEAVRGLRSHCQQVRVLGSYSAHS
jgi:prephenate dehydratase